jgi:alpha-D-ribose 1-methylphosphonate 5-triphosphate synthase subunit PhnH
MSSVALETDVQRAHRLFRAALLALAYPGRPATPAVAPLEPWPDAVLAERLVDAVWDADTLVWRSDVPSLASVEDAAVLLVLGSESGGAVLHACRGTEEAPEDGATVVYVPDAAAPVTLARLTGPGIETSLETTLPLAPGELAARAEACATWPLGVDVLVVRDGALAGLPRTTAVEVLA